MQLYLFATGNYDGLSAMGDYPDVLFTELKEQNRISRDCFGFLKEVPRDQIASVVSFARADPPAAPLHKLMRFCFAHGVRIGHDTRRGELVSLAKKIIENEAEGVALTNAAAMMQQAIDLAVLGQNVEMFRSAVPPPELRRMTRVGTELSRAIEDDIDDARREVVALGEVSANIGHRKSVADFQHKVLYALRDGKGKTPARKSRL
jgi:hypothetical protein